MDASRFDRLARRFARRHPEPASGMRADATTRRQVLRGALGGAIGALVLGAHRAPSAAAQSTTAGIAEAINAYRQEQGLPAIPVSEEMTQVAQAHVADIVANHPEAACNGNLHSWSTNGNWTGGCYDLNDEGTWPVMLNKPQEIAGYPGKGYEISAWATPAITAGQALSWWQGSAPHNAVILNQDIWTGYAWGALGGWVENGYACAWFGVEPGTPPGNAPVPAPPAGEGSICPWGPNQCLPGYVWRVSTPDDLVCVTPDIREQVAEDNAQAEERKDPACAGGDCEFGEDQCLSGYVWRVITPDDLVCVTPEMRDQVADDNAHAEERKDPACATADAAAETEAEADPNSGAPAEPDTVETGPAPEAPSEAEGEEMETPEDEESSEETDEDMETPEDKTSSGETESSGPTATATGSTTTMRRTSTAPIPTIPTPTAMAATMARKCSTAPTRTIRTTLSRAELPSPRH